MTGPRQPAGPRAGAARRVPGGARTATHATAPARAALEPSAAAAAAAEPEPAGAPPLAGADDLTGWQLLLAELNAMLRDPTLTRALTALAHNIAAGVRAFAAATAGATRELARALARFLALPWLRRALLALLLLALPLALLSLLGSSDNDRGRQPAQAATGGLAGPSLGGVAMPDLRAAPDRVRPVRVALVLDRTYGPATLRRELRTLGTWLSANHAPGTRVSVIDARSARASGRLRAADLSGARAARPRPSTPAAIRSACGRHNARRLLVTVGSAARSAAPAGTASTLRVATHAGAGAAAITRLPGAHRSRVTIDDRRPNALAASIARAIMSISGERERR
ncbi:MAG: hypothetical protein QOD69_1045 [Solirubrobacteraceae bacterium]|nr:hypothetical protein [Solirubrobacteraceae bacterium]